MTVPTDTLRRWAELAHDQQRRHDAFMASETRWVAADRRRDAKAGRPCQWDFPPLVNLPATVADALDELVALRAIHGEPAPTLPAGACPLPFDESDVS